MLSKVIRGIVGLLACSSRREEPQGEDDMDVKRELGLAGPGGRPEHQQNWRDFLQEECFREGGLLCFYDREKSPQVSYLCGVLAQALLAVPEDEETVPGFDLLQAKPKPAAGARAA